MQKKKFSKHVHNGLMVNMGKLLDYLSPFLLNICILLEQIKTFHILFNTIPPCPQTEGAAGGERNTKKVCNCNER